MIRPFLCPEHQRLTATQTLTIQSAFLPRGKYRKSNCRAGNRSDTRRRFPRALHDTYPRSAQQSHNQQSSRADSAESPLKDPSLECYALFLSLVPLPFQIVRDGTSRQEFRDANNSQIRLLPEYNTISVIGSHRAILVERKSNLFCIKPDWYSQISNLLSFQCPII
jgi:hypothetical protein